MDKPRSQSNGSTIAPGPVISQAGERRSAPIESLRAVAALAVLAGHVVVIDLAASSALPGANPGLTPLQRLFYGGGFGVFFFFALTGYLLFLPFAKHAFAEGPPIHLRRYAVNRALRILPLYYAVVLFALLFTHPGTPPSTWARFLTLTENFNSATVGQIVGPAWSLVVEVHFYLILPFLAWGLVLLASGSLLRAALMVSALGAVSLYLRVEHVLSGAYPEILWRFNLPGTFFFFVPGMLLALLRISWAGSPPNWLRGSLARSDAWLIASAPVWAVVVFGSYRLDPLLGLASFLVLGGCVLPLQQGAMARALSWRPLAIIGVASYSLYLWHIPVFEAFLKWFDANPSVLVLVLVAAFVCIGIALLSYRFIEAPFLRLRRQWVGAPRVKEARQSG